jgi:inosine/xanthosine triphosphatase
MTVIVVGSTNPVKISAAHEGFQRMFVDERCEVRGISAPSGVSDQPMTDAETLQGAMNRARNVSALAPDADLVVGIEGGLEEREGEMEAFAWIVVRSRDGRVGKGRTGTFFLPAKVAALIREGKELGEADDIVFGMKNSKQEQGASGILTGGVIDRTMYYTQAMILALIPFRNGELYPAPAAERATETTSA